MQCDSVEIEIERRAFERWYVTQKNRDQTAKWHPASTLEHDKSDYPYGRYTKLSSKQSAWEVWIAAKSEYLIPAEEPLLIALDYDGTYTANPELWQAFIKYAQKQGHEVIVATMRNDDELDDMCEVLCGLVNRIIPTNRNAKRTFLKSFGIEPHIWIDDQPHFIVVDAQGADKGKMAESVLDFIRKG